MSAEIQRLTKQAKNLRKQIKLLKSQLEFSTHEHYALSKKFDIAMERLTFISTGTSFEDEAINQEDYEYRLKICAARGLTEIAKLDS